MASPNSNYGDILTLAIEQRDGVMYDNLSENTAFLDFLKQRGNMTKVGGGEKIIRAINYQGPGNVTRYSGAQVLNNSTRQQFTSAQYAWKQMAVAVVMNGLEELQVAGEEQFIEIAGSKGDAAEREMFNQISADIYSAGTADGGLQIGGLQSIVSDSSGGTVGNISSTDYSWWDNQRYDFSDNTVTPSASTIVTSMNVLWGSLVRGKDMPNLILMDATYWGYYLGATQQIQRITSDSTGNIGFKKWRALEYMGTPVVLDGGLNGDCPSAHVYMLNLDFLQFVTHRKRAFVALDPKRFATQQDAWTNYIGWAGNLVCMNRKLQGVMKA